MADVEKLNIDSIIARLLEGKKKSKEDDKHLKFKSF